MSASVGSGGSGGSWEQLALLAGGLVSLALPAASMVTVGNADMVRDGRGVEVVGDIAYVSDHLDGLRVLDLSDVTAPIETGHLDYFLSRTDGLQAVGDVVFLADRRYGLRVVDVSDPTQPTLIGPGVDGSFYDLVVSDGIAYAADADAGLVVVDVADPAAPRVLAVHPTPGRPTRIDLAGQLIFITDNPFGVRLVDISVPAAPVDVSLLESPTVTNVRIEGLRAYVTGGLEALRIFEISDPALPVLLSTFEVPEFFYSYGVEVRDDIAYLLGEAALKTVDVSDPTAPTELGSLSTPRPIFDCELFGDYAIVTGHRTSFAAGAQVIDVSDPQHPRILGELDAPGLVEDTEVKGETVYLLEGGRDLTIVDVSDLSAPEELAAIRVGGGYRADVEVVDGIAYVTSFYTGLMLVDVRDPENPRVLAAIDAPDGGYSDVEVEGSVAYVAATEHYGAIAFDVTDPTSPFVISERYVGMRADGVAIDGERLFLTSRYDARLAVLDVSNPSQMLLVGEFSTARLPNDVKVQGGFAYVGGEDGLEIVDVSNPAAPVRASYLEHVWPVLDVEIDGPRVFLANQSHGLRVFDVSDPKAPRPLSAYRGTGWAHGVSVRDEIVFIGNGSLGLRIVALSGLRVVALEVRPGIELPLVLPTSPQILPAAILGSLSFDVQNIDRGTLAFGPAGALPVHPPGGHIENANGDAFEDLLSHYAIQDSDIAWGDTEVCVSGRTLDGLSFRGCDAIRTGPVCGIGFEIALLLPALSWARRRMGGGFGTPGVCV